MIGLVDLELNQGGKVYAGTQDEFLSRPVQWQCVSRSAGFEDRASANRNVWLTRAEREELAQLSDKRATSWLAGRALAKQLLIGAGIGEHPLDLSIHSLDARGKRNRPLVYCHGQLANLSLTLAHTASFVVAAWCHGGFGLGIDLADDQVLSASFAATWFDLVEMERVQMAQRPDAALYVWTAKEAAYKAAQQGEAFNPLHIHVDFVSENYGTAQYCGATTTCSTVTSATTCDVVWHELPEVLISLSMLRNN